MAILVRTFSRKQNLASQPNTSDQSPSHLYRLSPHPTSWSHSAPVRRTPRPLCIIPAARGDSEGFIPPGAMSVRSRFGSDLPPAAQSASRAHFGGTKSPTAGRHPPILPRPKHLRRHVAGPTPSRPPHPNHRHRGRVPVRLALRAGRTGLAIDHSVDGPRTP